LDDFSPPGGVSVSVVRFLFPATLGVLGDAWALLRFPGVAAGAVGLPETFEVPGLATGVPLGFFADVDGGGGEGILSSGLAETALGEAVGGTVRNRENCGTRGCVGLVAALPSGAKVGDFRLPAGVAVFFGNLGTMRDPFAGWVAGLDAVVGAKLERFCQETSTGCGTAAERPRGLPPTITSANSRSRARTISSRLSFDCDARIVKSCEQRQHEG